MPLAFLDEGCVGSPTNSCARCVWRAVWAWCGGRRALTVLDAGALAKCVPEMGNWMYSLCPVIQQAQQELFVELRGAVFSIGGQYPHQSFLELSVQIAKE